MDTKNKNIIITGASSGIGKAIALELASKAKTLVLIARRKELLEQLSKEITKVNPRVLVKIFSADITDSNSQDEILKQLNEQNISIDLLINNAGLGDDNYFHESDLNKLQSIIDLNVSSVVSSTYKIVQSMMENPQGKGILFVGSGAGIAWMPGSAVYSASKHFITSFAMNLKSELQPFGIEVSMAAPGPVDSEFDKNAGIKGGMKGGPSQKSRISSEECAKDIIKQLEIGNTLILPGKKIRQLMKMYINFPWFLRAKLLLNEGKKLYNQKYLSK